jgi:hypothetical protein
MLWRVSWKPRAFDAISVASGGGGGLIGTLDDEWLRVGRVVTDARARYASPGDQEAWGSVYEGLGVVYISDSWVHLDARPGSSAMACLSRFFAESYHARGAMSGAYGEIYSRGGPSRASVVMGLVSTGEDEEEEEYEVLMQGVGSVLYSASELLCMLTPQQRVAVAKQMGLSGAGGASPSAPDGRLVLPHTTACIPGDR